jgi:hypothetical protein
MGSYSKFNGIPEPKGVKPELFPHLLLTFESVENADKFVNKVFPKLNYENKFKMLNKYFKFDMIGGYIPEGQSPKDTVKADYLFTLQHLLNKAKVVGIKNVVKSKK